MTARSNWVPAWSRLSASPMTARPAWWSASPPISPRATTQSIWFASRRKRLAARVAAAGPTWRRPAVPMGPRRTRRWPRSKRRWRAREASAPNLILHHAHRAAGGAGGERRISLQRGRHLAGALGRLPGVLALGLHRFAAALEFGLVDGEVDRAGGDVDLDLVAILHQADQAAFGGFRRNVPDRKTGRAAGKAAVGDERAGFAEALRFQIARRIEHLLHAGAAARTFIDDGDDVAFPDLVGQDGFHRGVLAFEHARGTCELQDAGVDARGLHDAAVDSDIAGEYRKPAVARISVIGAAD